MAVGLGIVRFGRSGEVEQRVPAPDVAGCSGRLDLAVSRGEFAEGNQRASTRGVVEGDGAEEVGDGPVDQADRAEGVAGRKVRC